MNLQMNLASDKKNSELYICESAESPILLAMAGFGVTVLPDILVPDDERLSKCPLENCEAFSFGYYYKSIQSNPLLKDFITLLVKHFEKNIDG